MMKELAHLAMLFLLRASVAFLIRKAKPLAGSLMVLAPHPDDEILGAGGCILAALEQNQPVHIVYLTDGEGACPQHEPQTVKAERHKLTLQVMQQLGIPEQHLHYLHLPDGAVPRLGENGFNEAVEQLCQLLDQLQPENVLATHYLDFWPYDHVACAELAEAALAKSAQKPRLYSYWVWAWYHLRPWQLWRLQPTGLFAVNISPWANTKKTLVQTYLDATSPDGKPWSGELPLALQRAFTFNIEVLEQKRNN